MTNDSRSALVHRLDQVSEEYSGLKSARALIQLIPLGIGSAIDSLFGNRANELQANRFLTFIEDLKAAIENLQADKVDKEYLQSDDFYFLCKDIFSKVVNERDRTKLRLFRNIFIGAITNDKPDDVFIEICTSLLAELNTADISVLKAAKQYNRVHPDGEFMRSFSVDAEEASVSYFGSDPSTLGLPEDELLLASGLKLRRLGLLDHVTATSPLGDAFIEFVLRDDITQ